MFRGLSESKDFPRGKRMTGLSLSSKQHHLDFGMPEWQQSYVSANHYLHDKKALDLTKRKLEPRNQSHFELGTELPKNYFTSEMADKFNKGNFAKVLIEQKKTQVGSKTTLVLGTDANNYETQNQRNYYDKSNIKLPEIQWKPQKEKYDILTNGNVDAERQEKACGFDFWNEKKDKKRISRNHTYIPTDNEVIDIITGRVRERKYGRYVNALEFIKQYNYDS